MISIKIVELENQLLDFKLSSLKSEVKKPEVKLEPSSFQAIEISNESAEQLNPKLISIIKGDKSVLKEPPNDIELKESYNNDEIINKIIVSYSYNLI